MRVQSAKQKGRRLVFETRQTLLDYFDGLIEPDDIQAPAGSQPGDDLRFSPKAQTRIGIITECKNQERLNIWDAIKQVETHSPKRRAIRAVVFKRNHSSTWAAIRVEDLAALLRIASDAIHGETSEVSDDETSYAPLVRAYEQYENAMNEGKNAKR